MLLYIQNFKQENMKNIGLLFLIPMIMCGTISFITACTEKPVTKAQALQQHVDEVESQPGNFPWGDPNEKEVGILEEKKPKEYKLSF